MYREKNKEKCNEYARHWKQTKRQEDEQYKLKENVSRRIRSALNDLLKIGKKRRTVEYVGCTIEFLKTYLEEQFVGNMSWENYGEVWEIDHIIPCKAWNLTDDFESMCCWNYRNMQPLYKAANRRKKDKYDETKAAEYIALCRQIIKM